MALTAELQALTDAYYTDKTAVDNYFKGNVLFYKLMGGETGRKTIPGGKTIDVPIEHGALPGGSFNATTKFDTSKKEIATMASFPWAAYYATITYDLDDKRANNGDQALVNIIDTKLRNGQKTIRDNMGTALFTSATTSGKDLLGLGNLFNTTTSTAYGGITEADMPVWKANSYSTSTVMAFAGLQTLRRLASCGPNAEDKPTLYITTELLKDAFEATLQSNMRYTDAKLAAAGFENVLFGAAPVVPDDKQTTGYVDALNLNYLDMLTHKDYNFTKPVWANEVNDPETQVGYIKWSGQLICKRRGAHARGTAYTAS